MNLGLLFFEQPDQLVVLLDVSSGSTYTVCPRNWRREPRR